jgi:hypothetical protein
VVVEARSLRLADFAAAERVAGGLARIVSNSWSFPGNGSQGAALDSAFDQPQHALLFSSGDDGYGAPYPASLGTVIAVGGTTLTLDEHGGYLDERAWSGTGSGCAFGGQWAARAPAHAQAFQMAVAGWAATGCGTARGVNDVAAVADPDTGAAVFTTNLGWVKMGGTSLATPLLAAVFALAGDALGDPYPAASLYRRAGTNAFHDVDHGVNGPCLVTVRCHARPGFDLPTGVGTPHGIAGF